MKIIIKKWTGGLLGTALSEASGDRFARALNERNKNSTHFENQ